MTSAGSTPVSRLGDLLDRIEHHATHVPMELDPPRLGGEVPATPGWYLVRTTASAADLLPLVPKGIGHTRFGERLERIDSLVQLKLTAVPDADGRWPVYTGHAKSLRARADSHLDGHPRTGCLSIAQHAASLGHSKWEFRFTPVSAIANDLAVGGQLEDCEPLRILGEQLWRARFGWPVLCNR